MSANKNGNKPQPVYVLGISGKYNQGGSGGDAHHPAAVLLCDGEIVAMAGEERFSRVKNSIGQFPYYATKFCLDTAGIAPERLDAIGWSNDPFLANERWVKVNNTTVKRLAYGLTSRINKSKNGVKKSLRLFDLILKPWEEEALQKAGFREKFRLDIDKIPFFRVDHHYSHAASAYYASGFNEATVITWDGSGDGLSATISHGKDGKLKTLEERLDFSIGEVYWTVHKFLKLSDEGSLMGLAGYGKPQNFFKGLVDADKLYMNLNQISRPGGTSETWIGYHPSLVERLGPPRLPDEPLEDRHRDIAADLQKLVEDFGFAFMRRAIEMTGCRNVAFAGGVALNAVMNGKIARSGLVDNIFIQPEAGDSGGALGAAYMAYQQLGHDLQPKAMEHAYWGAGFTDDEIEAALAITKVRYEKLSREDLIETVASELANKKMVGWFQGRAEWGPRALGARSILADPRDREMNLLVNAAVKYRDDWRPFAPSMIEEVAGEYMEGAMYAPFMIMTFPVKEEKKKDIAAVVHVDGTTRPQTVRRSVNPLYYDMIKRLGEKTGVPVVMNTSFNLKGEPVVNSPRDALRTFFSSGLDVLALGSFIIRK